MNNNMKKSLILASIIAGIIIISIPGVTAQSDTVEIPSWIRGVANFWVEGGINDSEFIEALEFLIDQNIIKLGDNVVVDNTMSELEKEYEEKSLQQLKNHVGEKTKMREQWAKLSNEYDQEIIDLKKKHDERAEQKSKEYHSAIQELEDKIKELENK